MKGAGLGSQTSRVLRVLQHAFTYNIGLKVVSLAVAIGLFSMVRGAEDATRSVFVDVVALLPPPGSQKMLVSEVPDKVRLTVRGSRSLVNSIRQEGLPPVQVDVREPGSTYYYFDPDEFELPTGVDVVQLAPASIPLTWADRVKRELPIMARLEGTSGPGLLAQAVEVRPSAVDVQGPDMEVDPLQHVETDSIDVSGFETGQHERQVPLERPPPHTEFGRVAVTVTIEVTAQEAERKFEGLEIVTLGEPVAQLRPDRVDLTLWGPSGRLDEVKTRHLVPTVDSGRLETNLGTQELPVAVRGVPDGLQVSVRPEQVLVTPLAGDE